MNVRRITLFALALLISTIGFSQKFGHINTQQLLLESPTVKTADTQIETYQTQLLKKGETMMAAFETKYKSFLEQANSGALSQIQLQQKEAELTQDQEALQQYETEVQQKLLQKREELYAPIFDTVKEAIEQIGKEGNYTMIFDTSTNSLLHAEDGENLLTAVKTKLGW